MRVSACAALFVLLFGACTTTEDVVIEQVVETPSIAGEEIVSNAGNYRVVFRTQPETVPSGELFMIGVWVLDEADGEIAKDVALVVDASMPQHQHGMNVKPSHTVEESGEHRIDGMLFHMPGAWTVTFDLEQDGITERAQVVIDVN